MLRSLDVDYVLNRGLVRLVVFATWTVPDGVTLGAVFLDKSKLHWYIRTTITPQQPTGKDRRTQVTSTPIFGCPVFDWDSRMLIPENYANKVLSTMRSHTAHDNFADAVSHGAR